MGAAVKVLFSRRRNDFEHVYDLPSAPRRGELVSLLDSKYDSFAKHYTVVQVSWSPDHTSYDVCVQLEEVDLSQ